jgi:hypothetical protein
MTAMFADDGDYHLRACLGQGIVLGSSQWSDSPFFGGVDEKIRKEGRRIGGTLRKRMKEGREVERSKGEV